MTTISWKLKEDLCRCCHAEGNFYKLSVPNKYMTQNENFTEMLKTTLDLEIKPVEGPFKASTFTICKDCILRLRDAHNFRQQVLECEATFRDMYNSHMKVIGTSVEVKKELPENYEEVKIELIDTDDDSKDGFEVKFDDSADEEPLLKKLLIGYSNEKKTKSKLKSKPKKVPKPTKKSQEVKSSSASRTAEIKENKTKKGIWTEYKTVEIDGETMYSCNVCDRQFKKRSLFAQHYTHVHMRMRKKAHRCRFCNEMISPWEKAAHMEMYHDIPAPRCTICDKKFRNPFLVLQHQRKDHMGEKNYECDICDQKFGTSKQMRYHRMSHYNIRPFKCTICDKAFKLNKHLKAHARTHGLTHFCPICKDAFPSDDFIKKHVQLKHPELSDHE